MIWKFLEPLLGLICILVMIYHVYSIPRYTILTFLRRKSRSKHMYESGPWYSLFTDLVLRFHTLRGRRATYVHELHKIYGPAVRISPSEISREEVSQKSWDILLQQMLNVVVYEEADDGGQPVYQTVVRADVSWTNFFNSETKGLALAMAFEAGADVRRFLEIGDASLSTMTNRG